MSIPLLRRLEREVLTRAAAVYTTSLASRAEVAQASGRSEHEVGLLPIPIDATHFSPAQDSDWREALASPVLIFVGRADDARKNLPLLLEAFATLREIHPDARLRLVGAPPAGAQPAGVDVVGCVDDVAPELRNAALFVLPSLQEGFCIAAAEALAAGLPVVSTPCGGPEDLIRTSGGGRVVASLGAEALAAAVDAVVRNPTMAEVMRKSGREYVRHFHAPRRFRDLLASALAGIDG